MTTLRRQLQLGLAVVMAVVMGNILVPLQLINAATVAAVFRLRKRALENSHNDQYLTTGYPVVPLVFIVVMTLLMVNAAVYNPLDTFIGLALTVLELPVYLWIREGYDSSGQTP